MVATMPKRLQSRGGIVVALAAWLGVLGQAVAIGAYFVPALHSERAKTDRARDNHETRVDFLHRCLSVAESKAEIMACVAAVE